MDASKTRHSHLVLLDSVVEVGTSLLSNRDGLTEDLHHPQIYNVYGVSTVYVLCQ
jgi:hypothetical protein